MAVILAPMKYSAKVAKSIPATKGFGEGFEKALEKAKVEAEDRSKIGPTNTEKIFRRLHEPLYQFIGRLNAGQYIIRPIFATYFAFLPNIGEWKSKVRKQSWAREIIGLSAKDLGDVIGRLSNEVRRNLSIDEKGRLSVRDGGNTDRMIQAYDRESAGLLLKGMMDKILKDDRTLNALKGADLSNLKGLIGNIDVLRNAMGRMDTYDKGNRVLLQKISGVINASESGMSLAEKHRKYRDIAAEVYGRTGKAYEYFLNRCSTIEKGYREMNDQQLYGSVIKKSLVIWKLNNSLDGLAQVSGVERSIYNRNAKDSSDASKNMLADMFFSLAKVNKGNASLSDALGLVYLQKINNMYGFMPANKEDIKRILQSANESSLGHLPKKERASLRLASKDIDGMAENLAAAMSFGNEIAKRMVDAGKVPDELEYLVRDNNYLMLFNSRALKEEIDRNPGISQTRKDELVNRFVLGEGYKDIFRPEIRNYLFGTGARHEVHTYLMGGHWAYLRGNDDPFKLMTTLVPTSRRFGDLGESEDTLKFAGLWDVFYRREKGMFKKSGGTPESALNVLMAQVVAKGAENDDRLFTLISDRATTLQSRNMLTFGTRYIHTLDYLLSTNYIGIINAAIKNEGKDPATMSAAEYEKTKARIFKQLENDGRIFDKAVWTHISDQDKRLVTLTQVKANKDFIFMNGELGDLIPLRVNLNSMSPEMKSMLSRNLSNVKDLDANSLSFQNMMRASTEKALNMRVSYIGEHGNVYRSMGELADSYTVTDKGVRQFLRDLAANQDRDKLRNDLDSIRKTVSDPQQVAIAAFRYGEKTRDYQPLFSLANVRVGTVADVDQQRMEAWKNVFRSGNPIEALSGMLIYGKETAADKFATFHESILYKKTLQIGSEDLFGIENQESRVLREAFAVADEYASLNKILARMERGANQNDIAFLRQFSDSNGVFDRKAAESFLVSRLSDLKRSYDGFEWFMTRDVHPIYGGTFPYYRDGIVSASFNAGLSTMKPSYVDQMLGAFKRENIENYPVGINWAMNWLARETVQVNLPLQQAFVHAVRFEDKMTRGIPNPYEIRYEGDGDVKRTLGSMGLPPEMLYGRLVAPGTITGPSDQFMQSQGINVGYTLSGLFSNIGFSGSKVGWAGAAALAMGPLGAAAVPGVFYAGKFANDAVRDFSRWTSGGKDMSEGFDPWKRITREEQGHGNEQGWWKAVKHPFVEAGKWITSINPNEGSAIADKEETNIAKRVSSHFYWYSNEFATPGDIPGREHFQWGTGRRVIEPGQQWKIYNLYEFKQEQEWGQKEAGGRYEWVFKEPKTSSVNVADKDDLAYASLSIRKRQTTVVDDYFKREQELSYYSPSRHMMGAMINPLIATNFISSTTERIMGGIYDKARDAIEEEGPIDPHTGRPEAAPRRFARKVGGATANFFAGALSTPLNIAAATLGGTNYIMKCSQCGSFVRRGAGSCSQCGVKYS
jgi:beta-galactosidase beta subunit